MLKLYGMDASQPCRTVSWLLRSHKVPFEYENVLPGSKRGGTKDPKFVSEKNKAGLVPVLEDGNIILTESAAIVVYLAEKYGWNDVYPLGDANIAKRAKVNALLHWTHRNSREFTIGLFAPLFRPDLKFTTEEVNKMKKSCDLAARYLERELENSPYLGGFTNPTLADYAVFADVGQCKMLKLYDFTPYPILSAWLERMEQLPYYKETHEIMESMKAMAEQRIANAKAKL